MYNTSVLARVRDPHQFKRPNILFKKWLKISSEVAENEAGSHIHISILISQDLIFVILYPNRKRGKLLLHNQSEIYKSLKYCSRRWLFRVLFKSVIYFGGSVQELGKFIHRKSSKLYNSILIKGFVIRLVFPFLSGTKFWQGCHGWQGPQGVLPEFCIIESGGGSGGILSQIFGISHFAPADFEASI